MNVTGTGTVLDSVTVFNTGSASAIDISGALTLSNGTTITNTDGNSGETVKNGATLTISDTSSISGGKLVNQGTVNIEESTGATLDNVDVTGGGTINVDANAPSTPPATLTAAICRSTSGSPKYAASPSRIISGALSGIACRRWPSSVEAIVRSIMETGEPVTGIEVAGQRADQTDERFWITYWHPLRGPTGEIVGVNVAAEEITERKRSEQEMRARAGTPPKQRCSICRKPRTR